MTSYPIQFDLTDCRSVPARIELDEAFLVNVWNREQVIQSDIDTFQYLVTWGERRRR